MKLVIDYKNRSIDNFRFQNFRTRAFLVVAEECSIHFNLPTDPSLKKRLAPLNFNLPLVWACGYCLLLIGCSSYQSTPVPQVLPDPNRTTHFSNKKGSYQDPGQWWRQFEQKGLDQWMEKTLKSNPSVLVSKARVEQKLAIRDQSWSTLFPNLNFKTSRSETLRGKGAPQGSSGSVNLALESSYQIDLFGENSDNLKAAEYDLLGAVEDYKFSLATTSSNLAKAWFAYFESYEQLQLSAESLKADQANEEWIQGSYRRGQGQAVNVLLAREQVLASKLQTLNLETQLEQRANRLRQITGEFPEHFVGQGRLPEPSDLLKINAHVSSRGLSKRPEVAKAVLSLKSQDHRVAAAVAARFPRVSLSASMGTSANQLSGLSDSANLFTTLVGNLTLPIFDMGGRKAEVKRQEKILQELLATYKKTLLQAYSDAQNALSRTTHSRLRWQVLKEQIRLSKERVQLTKSGYLQGLNTWDQVLSAQQQSYNYQKSILAEKRTWAEARVDLFTSLGGNWQTEFLKSSEQTVQEKIKENP